MSGPPQLIELLRAAVDKLEQREKRDAPEMQELKRRLALMLAELEMGKAKAAE
jgi:hypothetical protein